MGANIGPVHFILTEIVDESRSQGTAESTSAQKFLGHIGLCEPRHKFREDHHQG